MNYPQLLKRDLLHRIITIFVTLYRAIIPSQFVKESAYRDKIFISLICVKKTYFPYYTIIRFFSNRHEIFNTIVSYRYDITSLEMYFLTIIDVSDPSSNYDFFRRNIWKVIDSKEENSRVDFNEVPQRGTGVRRWRRFNRSSFNCGVDLRSTKLLCSPKRICHTWK